MKKGEGASTSGKGSFFGETRGRENFPEEGRGDVEGGVFFRLFWEVVGAELQAAAWLVEKFARECVQTIERSLKQGASVRPAT